MSADPPPAKRARADDAGGADANDAPADEPKSADTKPSDEIVVGEDAPTEPGGEGDTAITSDDATKDAEDKDEDTQGGSGRIKKRKVCIFLAYVGKGYQGFQRNPGAVTIEDELERAIVAAGAISADNAGDFTKVGWTRAARTDKGVSAVGQSISLRMMLEHPEDDRDVIDRINEKLPDGFEMFGYSRVTGGFNAKTMCDRRRYEYVIPTCAFDPKQCRPRAEVQAEAQFVENDSAEDLLSPDDRFQFDEPLRRRVEAILRNYCGTHNFHNYTVRVDPKDPAAMRYIVSFDCSSPFVVDGIEFVRCTVVGQSFMLHQIRKLIGMMLGVARGAWKEEDLLFALNTRESVNTPMAPELGLFLCECIYHAYNTRFTETHQALALLPRYADKVERFKTTHIYPHMAATERDEGTMQNWVRMLPVKQVRGSVEAARRKDGGRWEEVARAKAKTHGKKGAKRKASGAAAGGGTPPSETPSVAAEKKKPEETDAKAAPQPAAPASAETVAPPPTASPIVEVPPPPPPQVKAPPGGYAKAPYHKATNLKAPAASPAGGRGGRGRGPSYELGGGRGGRGRGRGPGPKNRVRNAHAKSEYDFDPAELSD